MNNSEQIIIENKNFLLSINADCTAESLIYKPLNKECLCKNDKISIFSLTEERPYNNEIKLAYPTKMTTFQGNRVRREGNKLFIGFELIAFEAVVELVEKDDYVSFKLLDFLFSEKDFQDLSMTPPPVYSFRLLQLPIKNTAHFGEWLNVMWDEEVAITTIANSPHAIIDSEKRNGYRILTADCCRDIKLRGTSVSLIVNSSEDLLDSIEVLENDFNLPKGVKSRRSDEINRSIYWTVDISPLNVDEHIEYAKKGGFSMMLIFFPAIVKNSRSFTHCGNYEYKDKYPNGKEDLKAMLAKIKNAGITPGFHFLHTHIGLYSKYVTPVADHRLNLTRHFTLAKPLSETDDVMYVEQNPEGSVMHEDCRVLKFDGELIYYDTYSGEYPYCFKGLKRGHYDTNITSHKMGTIGGILDISEFSATSVYIDQNTSLQDEIAEKIADIYDAGFEFVYFDGSEGTNPPFAFNVPNAQYRVYKKLGKTPLFCEGAAKAHFSWHMLSGGNAFDVFPTDLFKESIVKYPLEEAGRMAEDFTRVNFGWWEFFIDTQPDTYEFGTSKAAAWDCPATIIVRLDRLHENARTDDIFEVMRRWEDVRKKNLLTNEQKKMLKDPNSEHILLINENDEYELASYTKIDSVANSDADATAYIFERNETNYVVYWHNTGSAKLALKLDESTITVEEEIGKNKILPEKSGDFVIIPMDGRKYLSSKLSRQDLIHAFKTGEIIK